MGLSKQAMAEIESLAVGGGESGISLSKQQTTPGVGHLIVSLGGSGADMCREAKGLINQNCSSDEDKHKIPERVAYVAFDTAANEKDKVSSRSTGQVKLTDDELTILSDGMLGTLLDPSTREFNKSTYPWIYRWLDTGIPALVGQNGAGGIRQAGRAMLFLEIGKVVDKIRTAITNLITGTNVESLNVYILSGVSGGTGSGTFLDMAYIVRQVANEVIGAGTFKKTNIRILGYLIMPDVNLLNADSKSRPVILRNAGAALQELDHAMRLQEIGDYYDCQYSNTMTVKTDKRPFDYVHLISAKPKGASMPDNPYQHCLDTVAGSILCFVSSQKKTGGKTEGGEKADNKFPVDSYYSNITQMQNTAKATSTYKERSNCYISVGYDCWEIPADRLVKYIFTLMFSKVNDLFNNEPTQNDAYNLLDNLGLGCDQKIMDFLGNMTPPLIPNQYSAKQLFGREAMELSEYLPFADWRREVNKLFTSYMNEFAGNLQKELQQTFKNPEKGPIWTNHIVVSGTNARIEALDRLVSEEKHKAMSYRTAAQSTADACIQNINRMRSSYKQNASAKKCQEYIAAWNSYFRANMEVYCYDLLIGTEDALRSVDSNLTVGFYDYALNKAAVLNNRWLDVTQQVLEELKNIVQRNTDEFRKASVRETGHGFAWNAGEIPNLDKAIGDIIAKNGIDQSQIMQNFLNQLLGKADEWAQSVDVRKFIEEFLEQQAQSVLNVSLEGLLSSCFDESKPLAESIQKDLMPYMIKNAKPLFDGDQDLSFAGNITIPAGCAQIEKGVKGYIGGRSDFTLSTSYLRNRISVICTSVGLSLHDYTLYEKCEQQISLDPNARGLFLNQGEEGFVGTVNYMKMPLPFVIPTRKRAVLGPAPDRFARFERDLLEEFRQMRKDRYPFLKFEKTSDQQDYNLYINLSVGLNQSGFYNMTREDKYRNYKDELDSDKLRELIEKLKEIRYNTGLPETTGLPKRLVVCENILSAATQEMKDRYHDVRPDQEEKIKEEVAWEVVEWYYVSSYSFYMKAKEEKAKYDEIEKKIEELESILDQLEARPERCAVMAKMLAVNVLTYDPKYFRFVYELNGEQVELLNIEPAFIKVKEMKLFEELERLRNGNPVEQELYKELEGRTEDSFDSVVDSAYEKAFDERGADGKYPASAKNVRIVIDLYKKLEKVSKEAEQKKRLIENALAVRNPRITKTENAQTREFYTVYSEGITDEFKEGRLAGRTTQLGIVNMKGELLPESEIFGGGEPTGWTCSKGHKGNTGGFCSVCGEPKSKPEESWDCPKCGKKGIKANFCDVCGTKKPVHIVPSGEWVCTKCGQTGNTGNFCSVCGEPKPEEGWTCSKGHKGNKGNFCSVCGEPKSKPEEGWDCPQCGKKGIKGNFCDVCGMKKPVKMAAPSGEWICTECGQTGNTGNFCAKCGSKRP